MLKTSTSRPDYSEISKSDRRRYVLKTDRDIRILLACKKLLHKRLSSTDQATVRLILSQLADDWRRPLLVELSKLMKKYRAQLLTVTLKPRGLG